MTTMNLTQQPAISTMTTQKLPQQQIPAKPAFSMKQAAMRLAPSIIEGSIPFAAYMIITSTFHTSDVVALSISSLIPAAFSIVRFVRNRRVDIMSMIILLSIVASIAAAVIGGSPQLLLIRESAFGALFGLAFLVSLLLPQPLFFYLARHFRAGNDAEKIAIFTAQFSQPKFRTASRIITAVWGVGCLAEFALRVFFVFTLPVPVVLALSSVVFPAIYLTMAAWTFWYMRRMAR